MKSLRCIPPALPLFLAVVTVVESQRSLNVYYTQRYICALKGSMVTMTFTSRFVKPYNAFWSKEESIDYEIFYKHTDLSTEPEYSFRVQYFNENDQEFTMRLSNVTEKDQRKYYGVLTPTSGRFVHGRGGVRLDVTDLQVEINPGTVAEGDDVILTCKTTCSLTETSTFTWYKEGQGLIPSYTEQLHLQSVTRQNAGTYSCGVLGQTYQSPYVILKIYNPPRSISVSISPSGDIVEGSSVTLTCNSDLKLPGYIYTWNRDSFFLSTGPSYFINQVSSVDSGEYQCQAIGFGRTYSDNIILNVLYPPKSNSVSVFPIGEIVEGSLVTLTCNSDANPPVHSYTWYRGGLFLGTGKTYSINEISSENSGEYICKASNPYGKKNCGVTLDVLNPPKSVSVSISPSAESVTGRSVTLTCSSDANPPVYSYTWYKVDESSPVGSGQSYRFNLSSSSGGWFYCVAQNKLGSKRAAPVLLTLNDSSLGYKTNVVVLTVTVCVGVGMCSIAAFTARLLFLSRRKKQRRAADNRQDGVPRAEDSTYTSLEPMTRSSNDVYSTISVIHPRPPNNTYSALNSHNLSADYVNTFTTARKHP